MAYIKLLWFSPESGRWTALMCWLKGHAARPHKHLSAAHALMLLGKLQVRDTIYQAGNYLYEANGVVHGGATTLEDTEAVADRAPLGRADTTAVWHDDGRGSRTRHCHMHSNLCA